MYLLETGSAKIPPESPSYETANMELENKNSAKNLNILLSYFCFKGSLG